MRKGIELQTHDLGIAKNFRYAEVIAMTGGPRNQAETILSEIANGTASSLAVR
jgi:hypothetical protein